jgi:hypothetical protein
MSPEIVLLILLQLKHFLIDFVYQTEKELEGKGIYGNQDGINHSIKHAIFTGLSVLLVCGLGNVFLALTMAVLDFVFHYHIDYIKASLSCKNKDDPLFWNHLGLDQFLHQLTYISILGFTLL